MREIVFVLVSLVVIASCKTPRSASVYFVSPEAGSSVAAGQQITLKLDAEPGSFDSITYMVDTAVVASKQDTSAVSVPTADKSFGNKVLTARVYSGGEYKEVTTNVIVLPSKAPVEYSYEVVNRFPHDTSSFTQGLEFHDGIFYESDGGNESLGESSLRKVDPASGRVLKKIAMPSEIFAEGLTLVGNRLIMLTWLNRYGLVYDKDSFEKLQEFPYQASAEGWGLCFDGQRLYKSDGTSRIYFLNKDTYQEEGFIEVFNHRGAINYLNELEFIDGKIYANVLETDMIVIIDPESGAVEGQIDLSALYPRATRNPEADVLNGIAWDKASQRLFVTGKKWDRLFEIKLKGF